MSESDRLSDVLEGLWLAEDFSFQGAVELLDDCLLLSRSTIKAVLKSLVAGYVQRLRASQVGPQCRHCEA